MVRNMETVLDEVALPISGAGETGGETGPSSVSPATLRIRAITTLVNNGDYLQWIIGGIANGLLETAGRMGPLNPMKITLTAMARFMRHPNAWKLLVSQLSSVSDEQFTEYWGDLMKMVKAIDEG